MDWQPIETAPKDETRILLFGPDGIDIGRFYSYPDWSQWEREATAEYDNDSLGIRTPTHWMPLPEPPHDAIKEKESVG